MARIFDDPKCTDRYNKVWIGGSLLCSTSAFEGSLITMKEYEENGAEIVHRRCV